MRRAGWWMVVLAGACLAAQGQQKKSSVAAIESSIRAHQYDRALTLTRAALRVTPQDARLWTLEGIVFSITGKSGEALTAFDKALKLSPGDGAALRGKAQILYQTQDMRAIPVLNEIVKVAPQDSTAQEMLAVLERKGGDCGAAVEHFRLSGDAVDAHPDSLEAYGDCLVETKQMQEAVPVFTRLGALLPERTYPKYDLAAVLVGTKQYDAALKVLDPLVAASSPEPDILDLASEAHEGVGDTPAAVSLLQQAIALDPSNPAHYVAFAALCLSHSSFQVGIDMIDAGLQRIPGDSSLYLTRGLLYAQLASYDKAEADFNKAEQLDSRQSLSSYALDLAEMQRNQPGNALQKIRAQLQAHPESPWLHYTLARLLDDAGPAAKSKAADEAMESALEAVKLKPDFVEARDLLVRMDMRAGDYLAAIEQCRMVLQYDPANEGAMYHLIVALRRSGDAGQKEEIQQLVKRLTDLQQSSLQKETERNRYKLVEAEPGVPK